LRQIDHTAAHVVTGRPFDRHRLPGQRRLVEDPGNLQAAVDRHHFPGAHQQQITTAHLLDGDSGQCVTVTAARRPGRTLDQQAQLAARPGGGTCLEQVPAGEHPRDHCAGEGLADRQRAGQGQQRDHVDTRPAPTHRDQRRGRRGHQAQDGDSQPQPFREVRPSGETTSQPAQEPQRRDAEEGTREVGAQPLQHLRPFPCRRRVLRSAGLTASRCVSARRR
jgi:hypothetical protein